MLVTLGRILSASKASDCLGIADRATIIDYVERALELALNEANWDILIGTIDVCADQKGIVTLPSFVGTVLAVNVCGQPTWFRNSWYQFHINGLGQRGQCGPACGYFTDDLLWTPTFQDITQWSYISAVCEDQVDGTQNPPLFLTVQGDTMDASYNQKAALTIPVTGPSSPGIQIPLVYGSSPTDKHITALKNIKQVSKPVTRGYVKLIAWPATQGANGVVIGYYGPNETSPRYRRIRVNQKCASVRVRYRRADMPFTDDFEVLPIASYQAMLDLLRTVRLRDSGNGDEADKMLARVVDLLGKIEGIEQGPSVMTPQFESWGSSTIDFR